MKTYQISLYVCGCGYETTKSGNAARHKKTNCGHDILPETKTFVLESDHLKTVAGLKSTCISDNGTMIGDHNSNVSIVNVNITLAIPNKSSIESITEAFNNPECISEIRAADPQQIPAILFKYTRGVGAESRYIKYDPDKDVVRHKDPDTGKEKEKDLKKFRNEYLAEQTDIYDDTYHIQYAPQNIQRDLRTMTTPSYKTGNKKEAPISAARVIKTCALGDHRMYKFPIETKEFYRDVAKNIDAEIKSTSDPTS
jgi:hypothetical protein